MLGALQDRGRVTPETCWPFVFVQWDKTSALDLFCGPDKNSVREACPCFLSQKPSGAAARQGQGQGVLGLLPESRAGGRGWRARTLMELPAPESAFASREAWANQPALQGPYPLIRDCVCLVLYTFVFFQS